MFLVILVFIAAVMISQQFTGILDVVTETNLICLVCDQEMFTGRQRFCYKELLEFMKEHGEEAIHDYGELNVKIDLGQKLKVQDRINELKQTEKDDYDKNKIKGIDFGNLDIDPKSIIYDPTLLDWDNLSEAEKNRLRKLYPHLFD